MLLPCRFVLLAPHASILCDRLPVLPIHSSVRAWSYLPPMASLRLRGSPGVNSCDSLSSHFSPKRLHRPSRLAARSENEAAFLPRPPTQSPMLRSLPVMFVQARGEWAR